MNIAIYCGSSLGHNKIYQEKAKKVIHYLASKETKIIYGGGDTGLMGIISNEAISLNINIIGVTTEMLSSLEFENTHINKLYKVSNIRQRKEMIEKLSDAFIALPGGFGTLEEISEVFTSIQISSHNKPCAIYNVNGYFDKLIEFLKSCKDEGFLEDEHLNSLIISDDINYIYNSFLNYTAPKSKWELNKNQ